jgi:hypothetical protein
MARATSRTDTTRQRTDARAVDVLAVAKGALAALVAVPVLGLVGARSAWALVVGCAVIAVEKRNHERGNRDRPASVAVALVGLAVLAVVVLWAFGAL